MVAGAPQVRLLQVPYDSGVFDARMGSGPLAPARAGAAQRLRDLGHAVEEVLLEPASSPGWRAELRTAFELHHVIAAAVTAAREGSEIPLMMSGNCNATLGGARRAGPSRATSGAGVAGRARRLQHPRAGPVPVP